MRAVDEHRKSEPAAGKNESKTSLFCASVDTTASSVES